MYIFLADWYNKFSYQAQSLLVCFSSRTRRQFPIFSEVLIEFAKKTITSTDRLHRKAYASLLVCQSHMACNKYKQSRGILQSQDIIFLGSYASSSGRLKTFLLSFYLNRIRRDSYLILNYLWLFEHYLGKPIFAQSSV